MSVPLFAQIVDLVGDEDNFGYGVGSGIPPCAFYNLAEPEDVGVFDLELSGGDETQVWTHDFTGDPAFGAGFAATSVTIEIPEYFSDTTWSTITVDGTSLTFTTGPFSGCNSPEVRTFTFPDASSASFANDGIINITFNENGDDIALDYSKVTVTYGAVTAAPPEMAEATASFAIYNQGRAPSQESHLRAVLSDHASLDPHVLGQGHDDELSPILVSDLSCSGEGCTPSLASGQSAQFQAPFEYPRRGLGRLEIGSGPNGASQDDETGAFTLTATSEMDSVVSWLPGRYLWIVADSAMGEDDAKFEAGQQLGELTGNDAQKKPVSNDTPTFGELSHLIAEFEVLVGTSGGDTPRLVIDFGDDGTLGIRLNDADSGENMVGDDDPIRFDTSGLDVAPELQDETTDYATALDAAGSFTIERIDFVVDDPGAEPPRQYRLDSILVAANAPVATAATVQAAGATPRPSAPATSQPFTHHPPRDVAPQSLRFGVPEGGRQRPTGPAAERP